ncbi:F0F1 ATP synthase subunit delta [Agromyces seonyuensis]|uniref:ATP synthase subunit delta n=1 Tax=Agromyces seonyuensis TaxID=2662446 RepID=A0A6I4NYE4_9MICO|nr:F0F1 ATP synthase subunit delta [Agromyces seonyuensis]MWB99288.1 F0F1 ATP synthase subunit delta [Agromyces seonyuensis]
MGSATRQALSAARAAVDSIDRVDTGLAEDVFAAGRVVGESAPLRGALADAEADAAQKRALTAAVFGSQLSAPAVELVSTIASHRWSRQSDLLAGIEEAGIRLAVRAAGSGVDIPAELFAVRRFVAADSEVELALASKLSPVASRVALVERLFAGTTSASTLAIVRALVQQPRGRRIGESLGRAADLAADELGFRVATVTSATPLTAAQLDRLSAGLGSQYEGSIRLNDIVDPTIVGGLRVQIGDDVIDGSIAARLESLRQQLAG